MANLISPPPSFSQTQTQTETEETLTITTYYPAPYGVYNEMRLFPHTPPSGCDSTKIGTMYYDSNEDQTKVCTKDGWKNIGGGKTNIIQKVGDNDVSSVPSGSYGPLDDMDIDIVLSGNSALVHFSGVFWIYGGTGTAYYRINRDNGQEYVYLGTQQQGGDTLPIVGQHLFSSLSPGSHNFKIEVRSDVSTFLNLVQTAPQVYRRVMQVTDLNI